jgi:hypothetical protein
MKPNKQTDRSVTRNQLDVMMMPSACVGKISLHTNEIK